jgi:hypothetical protein
MLLRCAITETPCLVRSDLKSKAIKNAEHFAAHAKHLVDDGMI